MKFAKHVIDLAQPRVMGILNITPDSFYDGGKCYVDGVVQKDFILKRVGAMVADGADFIDVGGESTRPGAHPVSEQEELDRVLPVVEIITKEFEAVVSVDTSTPRVMSCAASLGAGLINDVRALGRTGALAAAANASSEFGVAVCLMHMQGSPANMQAAPVYRNAVDEVFQYLGARKALAVEAGIPASQIIVDPGIGFGKTDEHNLALMAYLNTFNALGATLLGASRKSLFQRLLGRAPPERLAGGLACVARALQQGVSILRVHDVAETADMIKMWQLTARAGEFSQG